MAKKTPAKAKKQLKKPASPAANKPKTAGKASIKAQNPKKTRQTKPRGSAHVTRPTPEEEIAIADRRDLVLALSRKGTSVRQISRHLKDKGFEHCSPTTVHADLEFMLEDRARHRVTKTELLVEAELDKIDNWEFSISPLLERELSLYNNVDAKISVVNALIRLQNQRDRFLRISKPQKIELSVDEMLARLLELDVEELPDVEGDDDDE